jgi:glycosyltransferase involved in cell wall biosynthesis
MRTIYGHARIACLPSYREGLPKVLIEAAACSLPIVTTDVPGCRKVVIDGVNVFLVPPRDAHALADALLRLIADPDICREMGAQGRALCVQEFSVDRVVEETLKLYRLVSS